MSILLAIALASPAAAETVEVELLRPDGRSFALRRVEQPRGDEQIVVPDGDIAWSLGLERSLYDGRLEVCVDLSRWEADGLRTGLARACVVLEGRETPQATVTKKTDDLHLRLTVRK